MTKRALLFSSLAILAIAFSCKKKPDVHPVAIIGMDGLEWRLIREMFDKGELPNLRKIVDNGVYADMETLEPMLSPAIWTTIATGVSPETHGITWFMVKDKKGNMIPVTSDQRRVKALWNMASDDDRSVDVVGWWATWPAEKVNGTIISDHMGYHIFAIQSDKVDTDVGNTYPENMDARLSSLKVDPFKIPLTEIRQYMNISDLEYNVSVDMKALCARPEYKDCLYCKGESKIPFCHFNPLHHFLRALATVETFSGISLSLLKDKQPDLYMVYFEWPDVVSHQYMKFAPPPMDWVTDEQYEKYKNVIHQTYIKQDQVLGGLLAAMSPDTNVLLMSDHGFKIGDERLHEDKVTTVAMAHIWHHSPAFFAMAGPDIRKGSKKISAKVQDIAPTVLALMAMPVPEYMEGKVLAEGILPAFLQKFPIRRVKIEEPVKKDGEEVASGEESGSNIDPQIKEHLKALGYIGDVDETGLDMNRVNILVDKGRFDEAAEVLEGILAQNPQNLMAISQLCELNIQAGRFRKAAEACSKVQNMPLGSLNPQGRPIVGKTYADWGIALLNMGNLDAAANMCTQAINIAPRMFMGPFCLGRIAELRNNSEEAIKFYRKTLELNPMSAEAYNNIGNCLLRKDKYKEAIENYSKAAQANPKHVECHHNAGIAYLKMGKTDEAEKEFRAALDLNPGLIPSITELGNILMSKKKYAEAADLYRKWAQQQPLNYEPLLYVARAEMAANNADTADEWLKKAYALNPDAVNKEVPNDPLLKKIEPHQQ